MARRHVSSKTRRRISHGLKQYHKKHYKPASPFHIKAGGRNVLNAAQSLTKSSLKSTYHQSCYDMPELSSEEKRKRNVRDLIVTLIVIIGTLLFTDAISRDGLF